MSNYPNLSASKDACAVASVLELKTKNQLAKAKALMITAAESRVLAFVTRAKTWPDRSSSDCILRKLRSGSD
jgi:hypothetical protein